MQQAILLISCADKKGIVAKVSSYLYKNNWNVLDADQHIDSQSNTFFMRMEWELDTVSISREEIFSSFGEVAEEFDMQWEIHFSCDIPRVAIFVSKHLHCLYDLLYRYKAGQLNCQIPLIVSNHSDAENLAQREGIKFLQYPITLENRLQQEKSEIKLLEEEKIDLIVLARYHQILSRQFVDQYQNRIINIHHSFLPSFAGKSPYAQAYTKGVKIIGATSHYVTEQLDQGPIIEQDTVRISHRDSLDDLVRKGEDLERIVLNRAVRWHLQRKILCYGNKTVIFE